VNLILLFYRDNTSKFNEHSNISEGNTKMTVSKLLETYIAKRRKDAGLAVNPKTSQAQVSSGEIKKDTATNGKQ
jgi:hypothetical protein